MATNESRVRSVVQFCTFFLGVFLICRRVVANVTELAVYT